MRILAIDTATEACSAALWNDGTLSAHFEICPREHTQRILPLVQEVLTESGTTLSELDALAFGRGPGSFTGVRIGIGIAQGLALGAELPMIGVSTLATMAQGAWRKTGATRVLAAIDARMGEVYWAEYQRDEQGVWHGEETEAVLKPEAVAERLAQLSGSVLLLNRIEAQTILTDCTDFSLDEQLRQCILVTRQKWRDKPLQFEAELAPCTYHGSEALVKEIWLNLLDNAAKFSPENGTISVTLHCEQGRPVVAVTDQGCGMDAETCCHIFEQFYQGDTSHRTQGNGLGLAMAQKIAALHGGAVTVDSRPGSGSCFTVVLQ